MENIDRSGIKINDWVNYGGDRFKVKGKGVNGICLGQDVLQEVWVPWKLFDQHSKVKLAIME